MSSESSRRCVCIELTESGYLEENERFDKVWNGLKEYDVLLALDDFGTGYSNLRCLSDLKPAYIKIDRSFTLKALNREYEYPAFKSYRGDVPQPRASRMR